MMRSLSRFLAIGAVAVASGCSTSDSIDLVFADPEFEAKPPIGNADTPTYRVGDIFRYRVGETLVAETVENVDAEGVWWRDNLGRRWIGDERSLVPARIVTNANGNPTIIKAAIESTGSMFPLTVGKTVAYRSTKANWLQGTTTQNRSCTVENFGVIKVAAGTFDSFKVKCHYDNAIRYNYYAPALGRIVLQTSDTLLDSVKRELIAFEQGSGSPLRTAAGPMGKPTSMAMKQPNGTTAGSHERYGVQLAAYRSPTRIKKVWSWIKRKGGPLLATSKPKVERHEKGGKPLFRLIVGDFATKREARAHCRSLKRKGVDCWPRARATQNTTAPIAAIDPTTNLHVVSR